MDLLGIIDAIRTEGIPYACGYCDGDVANMLIHSLRRVMILCAPYRMNMKGNLMETRRSAGIPQQSERRGTRFLAARA